MTPEDIKERLEQAGYALQCLPADRPQEYGNNWPAIPRTPLDNWILELLAASDTTEGREVKQRLQDEAGRIKLHATREQIAALDEMLPWMFSLQDAAQRKIVAMRMFRHPVSERHKYSWSIISRVMGLSRTRVRDLHEMALEKIVAGLLTEQPKAHRACA